MTQRSRIIRTESGREATALEWLCRLGIEPYRPVRKVAVQQGRRKPRVYSLFPGYLFATYPHDEWPSIYDLPAVIGYLLAGGEPATISAEAIQIIREFEDEYGRARHAHWSFKIGSKVRISSDIPTTDSAILFAGYEGLLTRLDKRDRATVELVALGRCTPVALSAQWLELVDDRPIRAASQRTSA